jgi:Holliday junction DNA helicase RuvA
MIALLTGTVASLESDRCIVDVHGVGYLVQASTRTLAALPQPPAQARLLVETVVREDAILLFGFADAAERDWFRLLTTVQGVGTKVALGILSALAPTELVAVIASGDRAAMTRAPGEKAGAMPVGGASLPANVTQPAGIAADVLSALANLGYRRVEAHPVVQRAMADAGDTATLDGLLRACLRDLAK